MEQIQSDTLINAVMREKLICEIELHKIKHLASDESSMESMDLDDIHNAIQDQQTQKMKNVKIM